MCLDLFRNNLLKSLEKEGKRYDFVLVDDIPEMLHTATEEKDSFKDDLKDLLLAYQKLSVKQKKEVLYLFYVKGYLIKKYLMCCISIINQVKTDCANHSYSCVNYFSR